MTFDSDAGRVLSCFNGDRSQKSCSKCSRIPSVSADPAFAGDVSKWAWLEHLAGGSDKAGRSYHRGHPVVYGEWLSAGRTNRPCWSTATTT